MNIEVIMSISEKLNKFDMINTATIYNNNSIIIL